MWDHNAIVPLAVLLVLSIGLFWFLLACWVGEFLARRDCPQELPEPPPHSPQAGSGRCNCGRADYSPNMPPPYITGPNERNLETRGRIRRPLRSIKSR